MLSVKAVSECLASVLRRASINSLTTPQGYILPGELPNVRQGRRRRFTLIVSLMLETFSSDGFHCPWEWELAIVSITFASQV